MCVRQQRKFLQRGQMEIWSRSILQFESVARDLAQRGSCCDRHQRTNSRERTVESLEGW